MKERLKHLQSLLQIDPEDTFLLYAIAKEYETQQDLDQALKIYLKLKATDPEYVGMYYHLGKLYEEMEQTEMALIAYSDGITIAKKLSDFHALSELNTAKVNLEIEM